MLFYISGTDIRICGTLHLLPKDEPIPPLLFEAIDTADDCIFESDLDNAREPLFAQYPEGDSLEGNIPLELFSATSRLWHSLAVPRALPDLKPWWVTLVLGAHLLIRAGYHPENGADRQLWNAAKRSGKRPFVLESIDALRAFDSAPMSEQISRLEFVVSNSEQAAIHFNRLLTGWRVGNTDALAHELQTQLDLSPITFRGLIHDRNLQWLPQILEAIERGRRATFVVGALHLAGDHSLQQLLTGYGYGLISAQTTQTRSEIGS